MAGAARRAALSRRRLDATLTEDGMGILTVHLGAEQVVAISDRIEDLARAMRQAGDPRTLDQLRADLAAQALLRHGYGPCPAHAQPTRPSTDDNRAHGAVQQDGLPGDVSRDDGAAQTSIRSQ